MKMNLKVPDFLKSVRYTLAVINGLFLVTGILLILCGVIVLVQYSEYESLITKQFFNMCSFTIATGIIICLVSVLGFYGAISEQFYAIAAYVIMLVVLLVFEIAIVVFGFSLYDSAVSEIRPTMASTIAFYDSRIEIAKMWDSLQMDFECCGVTGRGDWGSARIPVSCCHIDYGTVSPFECTTVNAYTTGCAAELGAWLSKNAYVIAVAGSVVLCMQVVLSFVAGWLAWRSKFEEVELES